MEMKGTPTDQQEIQRSELLANQRLILTLWALLKLTLRLIWIVLWWLGGAVGVAGILFGLGWIINEYLGVSWAIAYGVLTFLFLLFGISQKGLLDGR